MAVMMVMSWAGVTAEEYDDVRGKVAWETDPPSGGVFHIASFDEQGLHVCDIWDSADQFDRFVNDRLMRCVKEVGIGGEPDVGIYPVHAVWSPDSQRAGSLTR